MSKKKQLEIETTKLEEEVKEIKKIINLKTFYPYTDETIDQIDLRLNCDKYSGIVFPVCIDDKKNDGFRVLTQDEYNISDFYESKYYLTDFLKNLDFKDKKIFLSVVDFFDDFDENKSQSDKIIYLESLEKAIYEIYKYRSNIIINNSIYDQNPINSKLFKELQKNFSEFDYAYTMVSRYDDVSSNKSIIVPNNINYFYVVQYINSGKKIYLTGLNSKSPYRKTDLEEILDRSIDIDRKRSNCWYKEDDNSNFRLYYSEADITVISKESADLTLRKVLETAKQM